MKKGHTLKEFTLVVPEEYCEIMVLFVCETGKVYDLYCYADSIPSIEYFDDNGTCREIKVTTQPGLNPVFLHIKNKTKIFKSLLKYTGAIFITSEGSDEPEEFNREVEILEKVLQVHDLPKDIRYY